VINNEVPASTQIVQEGPPGTDVGLAGVGCSVVGNCEAAGGSVLSSGGQFSNEEGLVVPLINGTPGAIQAIPGTNRLSALAPQPPNPQHPAPATATPGKATVAGDTARAPVSCAGAAGSSCTVTLTLTAVETLRGNKVVAFSARRRARLHKRTVVLGRTRVTVAAGHRRVVSVMLNGSGRRLLGARRTLRLHLTSTGSGARSTVTVIFRAPVKKHRRKHH